MFLLVSVRHVGAHPGEHQHGVSMQISISLGKTFLRISRIQNIPLTWFLARVFVYVPPFISQILNFICWTVLIFILIYFERCDTENQKFRLKSSDSYNQLSKKICETNILEWAGLRRSIPLSLRSYDGYPSINSPTFVVGESNFDVTKGKSKDYFNLLIREKAKPPNIQGHQTTIFGKYLFGKRFEI